MSRIQKEFELWATKQGFRDLTQNLGRYNRTVVRNMWESWKQQAKNINGLTAALARAQARNADLVNHCRDHDTRRAAAVAQCAAMAAEVDRLNEIIARLSTEGSNAQEM